MYAIKLDANNRPVADGIETIVPVTIPAGEAGKITVDFPRGAFAFGIKRLPVTAEISVNGSGMFPIDEGDQFGSFIELETIELDIQETSTENTVIIFIR